MRFVPGGDGAMALIVILLMVQIWLLPGLYLFVIRIDSDVRQG